jgi:hypothetical protein
MQWTLGTLRYFRVFPSPESNPRLIHINKEALKVKLSEPLFNQPQQLFRFGRHNEIIFVHLPKEKCEFVEA